MARREYSQLSADAQLFVRSCLSSFEQLLDGAVMDFANDRITASRKCSNRFRSDYGHMKSFKFEYSGDGTASLRTTRSHGSIAATSVANNTVVESHDSNGDVWRADRVEYPQDEILDDDYFIYEEEEDTDYLEEETLWIQRCSDNTESSSLDDSSNRHGLICEDIGRGTVATISEKKTCQSPLETYLREINRTALLTAEEEKELAYGIRSGDLSSRDRMIRANLRLVVNIARSYTCRGLPIQDLIEEGNLGLMRAVEGFDPSMNTRFDTYASYWIKQSIKRSIVNNAKTIRIPAYMVELLSKWRKMTAELQDQLGRTPTQEEVAKALQISKKKLRIVKRAIQLYNSTPQSSEQSDDGWSLRDIVPDERVKCPQDEMIENENLKLIYEVMETMDSREAEILRMRFGLDNTEPMTLTEIGETLGLTRERVRQIESEILKRVALHLNGENK